MKKLVIGNWKMNPTTLDEAKRIYRSVRNISKKCTSVDVVICPPFVYLHSFLNKKLSTSVSMGAQNIFPEEQGAFTGEISPLMLKDLGVKYVIVGHSERRTRGENDEDVAKKVNIVLDLGMYAIVCFGERERNAEGTYLDFLKNQIKNSLNKVSKKNLRKLIVAYEPLWAIGAKEAMLPRDILEASLFIKKVISDIYGHDEAVSIPIIYGGTANFRNVADIVIQGQVDGLLVGRESINTPGFVELIKTINSL